MQNLKHKLNSSKGASMLIALVFMLICLFVGGSVLAAATANAYRIKHLSDQQQYLNQRSVATLIADELKTEEKQRLKLTVYDSIQDVTPINILVDGSIVDAGATTSHHKVLFVVSGSENLSILQRTVFESAILRYLGTMKDNMIDLNKVTQNIDGFSYKDSTGNIQTIKKPSDFWIQQLPGGGPISDSIKIQGTIVNPGDLADFTAVFHCGSSSSIYDYSVDFNDPSVSITDAQSQLDVKMEAYVGSTRIPPVRQITRWKSESGAAFDARVITNTTATVISWTNPKIMKGAA